MRINPSKLVPVLCGAGTLVIFICAASYANNSNNGDITKEFMAHEEQEEMKEVVLIKESSSELEQPLGKQEYIDLGMEDEVLMELMQLNDQSAEYDKRHEEELLQEQIELQEELDNLKIQLQDADNEEHKEIVWQKNIQAMEGDDVRDENINAEVPYKLNYINNK